MELKMTKLSNYLDFHVWLVEVILGYDSLILVQKILSIHSFSDPIIQVRLLFFFQLKCIETPESGH